MSTLAIYALGVLLCLLAGTALAGLLDPRGTWVGITTIPLGFSVLIALLYPVGWFAGSTIATPIVIAILVVALAVAVVLRLRLADGGVGIGAALWPGATGLVVLGAGVLAGALLLAATIEQGFATTIGVTNNDAWGYATLVDWLQNDPMPADIGPSIADPLTLVPWTTTRLHFGFGFEHFAAMLATVFGRQGFEVVNAAAAVGLAAAVGAWTSLAAALRRDLRPATAALVAVAVACPALIIPFVENYTTQFVALCLWPFAIAAIVRFTSEPGWRGLLVAGLACGALVGVYPAVSPWLVLPVAGVLLLAPEAPIWASSPLRGLAGSGFVRRLGRAAVLGVAVIVALAVVAPMQVSRGLENLSQIEGLPINASAAFFSAEAYAAMFLGSSSVFGLGAGPIGWSAFAGLIVLAAVAALALAPGRRGDLERWRLIAIAGGVLLTTLAIVLRYRVGDDLPYQVYKGLMAGGAVLGGLIVIGLLPREGQRPGTVRILALGLLAAIWIPNAAQNLQSSDVGATGFRAADVQMGRALDALPQGSVVLAEGAAADERSFQFRMMAAYFGDDPPHHTAVGLGTTGTYLTGGGAPEWVPAKAWTHVLTTRPQPIDGARRVVWSNGTYTLAAAPELDVTPYGTGWYAPEQDEDGTFAWTAAPAQVVVSNRSATARPAQLRMTVASQGRPRTLILTAGDRTERIPLPADVETPVTFDMDLPPGSATPVTLDADPGGRSAKAVGDPRVLMVRAEDMRVVPR